MKQKQYSIEPIINRQNSVSMYRKSSTGEKTLLFTYQEHDLFAYRMIESGIRLEDCSGTMFLSHIAFDIVERHYNPSDMDLFIRKIKNYFRSITLMKFFKIVLNVIFVAAFLLSSIGVYYKLKESKKEQSTSTTQNVFNNH